MSASTAQRHGSSPHTWGIRGKRSSFSPARGSSPHTWGIHLVLPLGVCLVRFIPTYVGHTAWSSTFRYFPTVHPHIRGAYKEMDYVEKEWTGSSPHTWGIPNVAVDGRTVQRFIPTYVGHTNTAVAIFEQVSVHPHIRGAYNGTILIDCGVPGSSPHTWGIHFVAIDLRHDLRFIPTYVGHTNATALNAVVSSVHPHIRGAYAFLAVCKANGGRFIPTYVGHTH